MAHSLYDRICAIRLTGAVLYDRGRALGRAPEELARDLKPLHDQYASEVQQAIEEDLGGLVMAVKELESEALKHEKDMRFLAEKVKDTREHAEKLKRAVEEDLKARGVSERTQGGYFVTLVGGKLMLR